MSVAPLDPQCIVKLLGKIGGGSDAEALTRLTDAEIMDAWRADLAARIARRLLVFERIDCGISFDDLLAEWQDLQRLDRANKWFGRFDAANPCRKKAVSR